MMKLGIIMIVLVASLSIMPLFSYVYAPSLISGNSSLLVTDKTLQNYTLEKFANSTGLWKKSLLIVTNKSHNFNVIGPDERSLAIGSIAEINMTGVKPGEQIKSSSIDITPYGSTAKNCKIVLKDDYLNAVTISDTFSCSGTHHIVLNSLGLGAIQNNLRMKIFNIGVKDDSGNTVNFSSANSTIKYNEPRYFAKVDNGVVTNVIVADDSFVKNLSGTWIETYKNNHQRGNFAGIGFSYNATSDQFIGKSPYQSWKLNSTGQWNAPVQKPDNSSPYQWNEITKSWVKAI